MVWFKVDDTLAFHHKTVAAGNAAMGLWVRAGAWCSQQLTDGFIPEHMVLALGTVPQAQRLVRVGLWTELDSGFAFWQWSENGRQPTKTKIESERQAARERMETARQKRRNPASPQVEPPASDEHDEMFGRSSGEVRLTPTRPDPTRPDPKRRGQQPSVVVGSASRRSPTTALPDDWQPTDEHRKLAAAKGLDLDAEVFAFRAHAEANDRRQVRWNASFSQWLANASKWQPARTATRSTTDERVAATLRLAQQLDLGHHPREIA